MDLSPIQRDILITLITLYRQQSTPIKGEEIAEVIHRNPGTVRNQMQALKTVGLVDGIPGPKGGYHPTSLAYRELNLGASEGDYDVAISRDGEVLKGVKASEIAFTTLCHPDVCQAVITIIGSVKNIEIGEQITIGPTPVNKLLISGEVIRKDEAKQTVLISTQEMISLPKKPIAHYMSAPLLSIPSSSSLLDALQFFTAHHIHGAPVMEEENLCGILTLTDIAKALADGQPLTTGATTVMVTDVVRAPSSTRLYEVIRRLKEREIGRLIVTEEGRPVGILTQSDIIRVFPSL